MRAGLTPGATARDGLLGAAVAAANLSLFALMATSQWAAWGGVAIVHVLGAGGRAAREVVVVVVANGGFGLVVALGFVLLALPERTWPVRMAVATLVPAVVGIPRVWLLAQVPSVVEGLPYDLVDWGVATAAGVAALAGGCLVHDLLRRTRHEEARRRDQVVRAARAIARLEAEEAATRRAIADQLHGQVQNRLALTAAGLEQAAEDRTATDPALAACLRGWAQVLDEVRERDVRALSHDLFPAGADVSTVAAVSTVLDRLPPSVTGTLVVGPAWARLIATHQAPAPVPERLVAVCTVEEALTNALKHGRARQVEVRMDARPTDDPHRWVMEVAVTDDGVGLPDGPRVLHGLARHAARIRARGGALDVVPRADGRGARLCFSLPFSIPEAAPDDPPDG